MQVLSTVEIEADAPRARRAHHVLSYLTQFYVQSLPPAVPSSGKAPPVVIPAPIAVPLVAVSRRLGIAPILTYTDTVLWNWEKRDARHSDRSEEHTSELQSLRHLVCRLLL